MWFLCMVFLITIMHIFLVKDIDCVKDLIMHNRCQNLAGVTRQKQRAKIVDHFMIN